MDHNIDLMVTSLVILFDFAPSPWHKEEVSKTHSKCKRCISETRIKEGEGGTRKRKEKGVQLERGNRKPQVGKDNH